MIGTPFKSTNEKLLSLLPPVFKPWKAKNIKEYIEDSERWATGVAADEEFGPEFAAFRFVAGQFGLDPLTTRYTNSIQGHPDRVPTTEIGVGNDPWAGMSEEEMRRSTGMLPPKKAGGDTEGDADDAPPAEPFEDRGVPTREERQQAVM